MPENPHEKELIPPKTEKVSPAAKEKDVCADDQKKRDYYYDDAHGYEIYTDEDEED